MRAYKKRPWAELVVNMTPLIDVVFLIIIFFIILINVSEMHIRELNLPKADLARESRIEKRNKIPVIIKSEDVIFLERKSISTNKLPDILKEKYSDPAFITVQIRADEDIPYETVKKVMLLLAGININRVEFSTLQEQPEPL